MRTCKQCKQEKPLTEYYIAHTPNRSYYNTRCKPCAIANAVGRGAKKEARRRYWINKYKLGKGCCDCGYNKHPVALDFHHHGDDKESGVPALYTYKLTRLFAEIRKCVVICANCHREHHANNGYKRR